MVDRVNIFPISEQAVLTTFKELSMQESSSAASEIFGEIRRFSDTNPDVFLFYTLALRFFPPSHGDAITWGALLSHRAATEEAKLKELKLPRLKKHFVEAHRRRLANLLTNRLNDSPINTLTAAQQIHRARYLKFSIEEPNFSRILKEKIDPLTPLETHEQNPIVSGIIFIHDILKQGLANRKNYF